jgi:hypothetical protein
LWSKETIVNLGTSLNRRHPRSVIVIRVLVTAWLTLAGALANSVLAYRVFRTSAG